MGSVSSEEASDQQSERCGSYSPSADVSGSDSSADFTARRCYAASTSCPTAAADLIGSLEWKPHVDLSEMEMMKERFSKLLLGEDMSGGGKGVCTALAISNAITNLSATVFGELWRLEPLPPMKKTMWRREMEWLLCVSDSIVEFAPSLQQFPEGGAFEVMVSRPRSDLHMNLPALRKLDAMLVAMLDAFRDTEFWYVESVADEDGFGRPSLRQEDKWWLPWPRVPPRGLSEDARRRLQQCRDCGSQILKAALAINSGVLAEIHIPDAYLDTLPKSGKSCLGEIIYRYITADHFSPECLLDCLDLSSEHHTLEIANRIESAIHVWKLKDRKRHPISSKAKKSSWGGKVKGLVSDTDRSHLLAQRAEGLFQSLRLRFPSLPQTVLDMNKIQYNKDVGQAILESYSRVTESLAFNITARIDDLIYVDDATKRCAAEAAASIFNRGIPIQKRISPSPFSIHNTPLPSPYSTPTFSYSTPIIESPRRLRKQGKLLAGDAERLWSSYAGNLKDTGDAPERN